MEVRVVVVGRARGGGCGGGGGGRRGRRGLALLVVLCGVEFLAVDAVGLHLFVAEERDVAPDVGAVLGQEGPALEELGGELQRWTSVGYE